MMNFLKLIQWPSTLLIAVFIVVIKFALIIPAETSHGVISSLSNFQFLLLTISICCIVSAGFIIEAIYNYDSQKINTPNKVIINTFIKEKDAFTYFILLNCIGVGLGFYISNAINHANLFVVFFVLSVLWYLYASALQQIAGVGNVIIALIYGLIPLSIGVFELYPAMNFGNTSTQLFFLSIIKDYAIFIALLILIRSIVKNSIDINGNYNTGIATLAVVMGRQRASKIAFTLSFLPLFAITYYCIAYLASQMIMLIVILITIVAPLLYTTVKLFNAEKHNEFMHCYRILNFTLISTVLSVLLFKLLVLH